MTLFSYPAHIEEIEPGEFLVTFPDVPEAITSGATHAEALEAAAGALAVAVEGYLLGGHDVPAPRDAKRGEELVALDPVVAARVVLVLEMGRQGLTKVALAHRIGRDEKAVRRMIAGKGASLDMILGALKVLGVRPALAA
jgi:antitoxin HicB